MFIICLVQEDFDMKSTEDNLTMFRTKTLENWTGGREGQSNKKKCKTATMVPTAQLDDDAGAARAHWCRGYG